MSADIDCIVLGAGVIGLAIARELAMAGREVLVVEQADMIGTGISSRNSEVIHAGIYYPPGSLKARLCVSGRDALYDYCAARGISHARIGKLIVATSSAQEPGLDVIAARARANGVSDLYRITGEQARELEPALHCTAALVSPSTGIVDSHGLMLALQGDAENHGASCVFRTRFVRGEILGQGLIESHFEGDESISLRSRCLINATGLSAPWVAKQLKGLDAVLIPDPHYCKGSYFTLSGKAPFSRLIYPMPDEAGLGVHLTLDLGGQAKFGPDTEWVSDENYDLDTSRCTSFYDAVRHYWPALPDGALLPGYTGIRPKIVGPNDPAADFLIAGPGQHGVPGLLNLFGIESPGLTACLAIARYATAQLQSQPSNIDTH